MMTNKGAPREARQARAEQIYELVGIRPDLRLHPPLNETMQYIADVQRGSSQAAEHLIATRLEWMHDTFASQEVIRQRTDMEMADILQIGCLAVIESAQRANLRIEPRMVSSIFRVSVGDIMMRHMLEGKLIPSLHSLTGRPTYVSARLDTRSRVPDMALPATDETLEAGLEADRTALPESVENWLFTPQDSTINAVVSRILRGIMPERYVSVVADHCGFNGQTPKTFAELGDEQGVTLSRTHQIFHAALQRLAGDTTAKQDLTELLADTERDHTNYGLRS